MTRMKSSALQVMVIAVLFLAWFKFQSADSHARHYITWDDLRVDEPRLAANGGHGGGDQVVVVNQDGHGDSTTVQGAVDMVPHGNRKRIKIYIHPGIYRERVYVPRSKPFISFIGKSNTTPSAVNRTTNILNLTLPVITYDTKASDLDPRGREIGTAYTATVWVDSDYFCATAVTFENSVGQVGDGYQAVALRVDGDRNVFYKVRIVGQQDTLLDNSGIHYFYRSYIQGSVDFICGQAKSLYQECTLYSVAESTGAIAAHHRDFMDEDTGFSFVGCTVKGSGSVFLGRAWGEYSRVVYSVCDMDDMICPTGWYDWGVPSRQRNAVFGEYNCTGKGSNATSRVPWSKSFNDEEARPFLSRSYIRGHRWLRL